MHVLRRNLECWELITPQVLTLKQTGKVQKNLPVILFGKEYWQTVVNWQALVEFGTIAQEDVDALFFTDDPQDVSDKSCISV